MSREKKFLFMFIAIFSLSAIISGCGGGGGGGGGGLPTGPTTKVSTIAGVVLDGPIKNARVFLDINFNGTYDDGEPFCITNAAGEYKIEYILESGTEYLIIAEGSAALKTEDLKDNPADGSNLTFVMFVKMTSTGSRNTDPVSANYRQDVTPLTFKGYVKELNDQLGGLDDANIKDIIESSESDVTKLFKAAIKDKHLEWQTIARQVAELVKSSNDFKDLDSTATDLGVDDDTTVNFSDKNLPDLLDSMAYENKMVTKIGEMIIAKPMGKASAADVVILNMNPGTSGPAGIVVKPGSLSNFQVSVTPYQNILEIPEFSQLKDQNYSIMLGGDITALDSNGIRDYNQPLKAAFILDLDGGLVTQEGPIQFGFDYLIFNGSTWVKSELLTSPWLIKTAPFVWAKKDDLIEKTVHVTGLSLLTNPVVVVKGHYMFGGVKKEVVLDAVALTQTSDSLNVKIPKNFLISEVLVVDSELKSITSEKEASVALAVTDSSQTTTVSAFLATGLTTFILNQDLLLTLQDGNQEQDFPGLGSYLDTKIVYGGVDMFLGLPIDSAVKQIINENVNRYLDPEAVPVFFNGTGKFEGVTIDSVLRVIKVALGETAGGIKTAEMTLSWSFDKNKVVRNYQNNVTGGDKRGSAHSSKYIYSTGTTLTNVVFEEVLSEMYALTSGYTQNLAASYEGTAIYERNSTDNSMNRLVSAKFDQKHSESNSLSKQTGTVYGLVTMEEQTANVGKLTFDGLYSIYLPSYGLVTGEVIVKNAAYGKGYNQQDLAYFNNNDLDAASILFTSRDDYLDYPVTTNPLWLIGIWSGTFTDSCDKNNLSGRMSLSVAETTSSWWGQSNDMTRNYGTSVEIFGSTTVRLKNDASLWSNGIKINDTRLEGNWSFNGCQGSYVLNKTP